jgi:chromosome segregation ATPase
MLLPSFAPDVMVVSDDEEDEIIVGLDRIEKLHQQKRKLLQRIEKYERINREESSLLQVECEKWWALDEVHKQSNAKLARILRKKDELNERLEALTKQPAELRTVQRICNALNADLKAAQKERAECSAKLEVHLAELSENVSKHNDRLNRELPALQRGRTKFEAQAKRMQAELENFQKITEVSSSIVRRRSKVRQLEAQLANSKLGCQALMKQLKEVRQQLEAYAAKAKPLGPDLDLHMADCDQLKGLSDRLHEYKAAVADALGGEGLCLQCNKTGGHNVELTLCGHRSLCEACLPSADRCPVCFAFIKTQEPQSL